jgi:hypothetical protein
MSAAKEIMIVEHSQVHSLNASKEAESNGSGDSKGPRAMGADGPPTVRRCLPDERRSLTHHFSVGGQETVPISPDIVVKKRGFLNRSMKHATRAVLTALVRTD